MPIDFRDDYNGPATTALTTGRTPDVGSYGQIIDALSNGSVAELTGAGGLRGRGAGPTAVSAVAQSALSFANGTWFVEVTMPAGTGSVAAGIRYTPSVTPQSGYSIVFTGGTGVQLWYIQNGLQTVQIGATYNTGLAAGARRRCVITAVGTSFTVWIDGVAAPIITGTNSTITAAGVCAWTVYDDGTGTPIINDIGFEAHTSLPTLVGHTATRILRDGELRKRPLNAPLQLNAADASHNGLLRLGGATIVTLSIDAPHSGLLKLRESAVPTLGLPATHAGGLRLADATTTSPVQSVVHASIMRLVNAVTTDVAQSTSHAAVVRLVESLLPSLALGIAAPTVSRIRLVSDAIVSTSATADASHGGALKLGGATIITLDLPTTHVASLRLASAVTPALTQSVSHASALRLLDSVLSSLALGIAAPSLSRIRLVSDTITSTSATGDASHGGALRLGGATIITLDLPTAHTASLRLASTLQPSLTQAAPWASSLTLRDSVATALAQQVSHGSALRSPMAMLATLGVDAGWIAALNLRDALTPALALSTSHGGALRLTSIVVVTLQIPGQVGLVRFAMLLSPAVTLDHARAELVQLHSLRAPAIDLTHGVTPSFSEESP